MFTSRRVSGLAAAAVILLATTLLASPMTELDKAAKSGQAAFLLIKDTGTTGLDQARKTIQGAMKQAGKAIMVEVDRQDPVNAALVTKRRGGGRHGGRQGHGRGPRCHDPQSGQGGHPQRG